VTSHQLAVVSYQEFPVSSFEFQKQVTSRWSLSAAFSTTRLSDPGILEEGRDSSWQKAARRSDKMRASRTAPAGLWAGPIPPTPAIQKRDCWGPRFLVPTATARSQMPASRGPPVSRTDETVRS